MSNRLKREAGRFALVDNIPFQLPVAGNNSPALMAAFSIDAEKAKALLPGNELHPLRLWSRGLLIVTVIDYRETSIGKYIEFSLAIACTHGRRPAPPLLPGLFMGLFDTGQYVYDLPVSTEISVKGGKGIWGMPKHQASLDFLIKDKIVSSQYNLDGQIAVRIDIDRPTRTWLSLKMQAINYCAFRGMLWKSRICFKSKLGFFLFKKGSARLTLSDHPRIQPLKELDISPDPIFTGFFPSVEGLLDDHIESWFLSCEHPPTQAPEGMESVINLGLSQEWPAPPRPGEDIQNG